MGVLTAKLAQEGGVEMAGNTEYKNKWQQENRERINLAVPKGYKAKVKECADAAGDSLNGYIVKAIDEKMERDGLKTE